MFRHEGPDRSTAQNCIVAGYLALVGGFVNCASFVLIGTFTSHVTGNVGRLGTAVSRGNLAVAFDALSMIAAFFLGAFVASTMIESRFFGKPSNSYGVALLSEATLLAVFVYFARENGGGVMAATGAPMLCAAMGMQNSLVSRLSGAIVRTTHLTGVVTDLGIEAARWFRWWRSSVAARVGVPLAFGKNPAKRPAEEKTLLLATIAGSFTLGSVAGAATSIRFPQHAMAVPVIALAACSTYAFVLSRRP